MSRDKTMLGQPLISLCFLVLSEHSFNVYVLPVSPLYPRWHTFAWTLVEYPSPVIFSSWSNDMLSSGPTFGHVADVQPLHIRSTNVGVSSWPKVNSLAHRWHDYMSSCRWPNSAIREPTLLDWTKWRCTNHKFKCWPCNFIAILGVAILTDSLVYQWTLEFSAQCTWPMTSCVWTQNASCTNIDIYYPKQ